MRLPFLPKFFLVFVLLSLLLFRYLIVRHSFQEGQLVRVTGVISEEPVTVGDRQQIRVGEVKIYTPRFPEFGYGEKVVVEGRAAKGRAGWYLREAKVVRVKQAVQVLSSLRSRALGVYGKFFPEPHAALLSGIVLGTKSSLDYQFFEALRKTGTLHIIVASGSNIALVGGTILNSLIIFLSRKKAVVLSLAAIWLYVVLVGFQPPIVRAAIMGTIAYLAQALGRDFDGVRALFISAAVLLLVNPLWLFDIGFQLSFAATAGIIGLSQRIGRLGVLGLLPRGIKENLATTLSAQIAVSPFLLLRFGEISLISPVVNVFVLPVVPSIMAGGAIIGLIGQISLINPITQVLSWFVWILLEYFVRIVELFGNF
ncbi:MAG: ComEC/Rec2 family competence protein [Candidatus Blackburnbacteria bacterium]|nr:ComEC/Rec2 family competence protein [Candidatus Blackburnbacteria bacterium]